MNSILGSWRLVKETATDPAGQAQPTLFGPMGIGIATFTTQGRMMAVLTDGRPGPIDGPRKHVSYCGDYTFDGVRLMTKVDGATDPRLLAEPQIRDARFEAGRLILRPPIGFRASAGVVRELIWERIG